MTPKTRTQIYTHRNGGKKCRRGCIDGQKADGTKCTHGKGGDRNLREVILYELGPMERKTLRHWAKISGISPPIPWVTENDRELLNPKFTEWMMGLPPGWVTDVELDRKHQLKMLGNGVAPPQAMLALKNLMERVVKEYLPGVGC